MDSSTLELKKKLISYSYNLLSRRDYSEKQLRDKINSRLYRMGFEQNTEVADEVLGSLKEEKYVDDLRYARNFVESRLKIKGVRLIRLELIKKGISRQVVDEVLSEVNTSDQEEVAIDLLQRKVKSWKGLDEMKMRQRAYGLLGRRGFGGALIRQVVEKVVVKRYNGTRA